jgi:hypothetical protein
MIQHDMMLFDHGMPRPDGTISREQRPEADVNAAQTTLGGVGRLTGAALASTPARPR